MKLKRISMIALACLLTLGAATAADAQTRRRTTARKPRASATSAQSAETGASAARTAATRVAEQIKSLGKFLYLYGPISKELAASEAGAGSSSGGGQTSPAATETMQRNRAKLREVFEGYRQQMDELETLFSSNQELRKYYARLLGVAASAAQAENAVASGRYDEGGRALIDVMNRLTDVLLEMRGT
jgi:hypothetical protein